jgi:hypothetical protein
MAADLSYQTLCWLVNDATTILSRDEIYQTVVPLLTNALCTDTTTNAHLLQEHLRLWLVYQYNHIIKDMEVPTAPVESELETLIKDIETTGVYTPQTILKPALYRYLLDLHNTTEKWYTRTMGCVLGALRQQYVHQHLHFTQHTPTESVLLYCRRIQHILCKWAPICKYERTGDAYIHNLLRTKLTLDRQVLIPHKIAPYDAIADQYGLSANDQFRSHIDMQPDSKLLQVQWEDRSDTDGFLFLLGVLFENLDGVPIAILCNGDIPRSVQQSTPFFFILSEHCNLGVGRVFGVGKGTQLYVASAEHPHTSSIYLYLQLLSDSTCSSCPLPVSHMKHACETPNTVGITNPLYPMCKMLSEL